MPIRYLRLVGEGQNNTHYCLLDISEQQERARTIHITVYQISAKQQERARTIHITVYQISQIRRRGLGQYTSVYQISQSSRRGLVQYTLLSIRYLRVVGEGQNTTHYCQFDISDQQESVRTIHIAVYQISQCIKRRLEQYTLLPIRNLSVVGEGQNTTHYCQ